ARKPPSANSAPSTTRSGLSKRRTAESQRLRGRSSGAASFGGPSGWAGAAPASGILNCDRRSASCERLELLYKVTRPMLPPSVGYPLLNRHPKGGNVSPSTDSRQEILPYRRQV